MRARGRTKRRLMTAGAMAVLASTVAVGTAPVANADECWVLDPGLLCGSVRNAAGYTMHTTTDLNTGDQPDSNTQVRCRVWNTSGSWGWDDRLVWCTQSPLGSFSTRGGLGTDVDAFTYAYRPYYVRFGLGQWRWRERGVWTKIQSHQAANCVSAFGSAPRCTVAPF